MLKMHVLLVTALICGPLPVPAVAQDEYRSITDRVRVVADSVPIEQVSSAAKLLGFIPKGEILHGPMPDPSDKWAYVMRLHGDRISGRVRANAVEAAEPTERLKRKIPFGTLELGSLTGRGDNDSQAAVFFNGKRVGDEARYSSIGHMWVLGDSVVLSIGGHAGNSAEWCDLYEFRSSGGKLLGESECGEPTERDGGLVFSRRAYKGDTVTITVKHGVYEKKVEPYEAPDLSKSRTAGSGEDVTRWNGKHAREVLADLTEQNRFSKLISGADVELLESNLTVAGACKISSGYLFCTGNRAHRGGSERAAFAISIATGKPYAAILHSDARRLFGGTVSSIPSPLRTWFRDASDGAPEFLPLNTPFNQALVEVSSTPAEIFAHLKKNLPMKGEYQTTKEFEAKQRSSVFPAGYKDDKMIAVKLDLMSGLVSKRYDADREIFMLNPFLITTKNGMSKYSGS